MRYRLLMFCLLTFFDSRATGWWHKLFEEKFTRGNCSQVAPWIIDTVATPPHTGDFPNQWYMAGFIWSGDQPDLSSIAGECYLLDGLNGEDGLLYIAPGGGYNCDSARLGAIYRDSCNNNTHKRISSRWIRTEHCTALRLEFDLILVGDQNVNDRLTVQYVSSQSPSTWSTLNFSSQQLYCAGNVPRWSRVVIPLQGIMSIDSIQLGFVWKNNGDCIKGPYSVAIDNLVLYGMNDCPEIRIEGPESACANADVALDNLSVPTGTYSSFQWNFGDGDINNTDFDHVTHQYSASGHYTIELEITSPTGCTSALQKIVTVFGSQPSSLLNSEVLVGMQPLPSPTDPPLNLDINQGHLLQLASPDPQDIESVEYRVGNYWGLVDNPWGTFPFTLATPGLYNVQVTAINACGFTPSYFNAVLTAQ